MYIHDSMSIAKSNYTVPLLFAASSLIFLFSSQIFFLSSFSFIANCFFLSFSSSYSAWMHEALVKRWLVETALALVGFFGSELFKMLCKLVAVFISIKQLSMLRVSSASALDTSKHESEHDL